MSPPTHKPVTFNQPSSNPLVIPEIVSYVISFVDTPIDLLQCSCVNSVWSLPALRKLYKGSMNDMRFRTPEIGWLNSLFTASRKRFARNMGFVKHLTIMPERVAAEGYRPLCIEKCRLLRDRESAELLLRSRGKGPTSLAIPFEIYDQDISPFSDLIIHPDLKSLTINHVYCNSLHLDTAALPGHASLSSLSSLVALSIHYSEGEVDIQNLCQWLAHCDLKMFQIGHFRPWFEPFTQAHLVQLLRCLMRHQNIHVLAFKIGCEGTSIGKLCADLEKENGTTCWPKLRALYLRGVDEYWLQKFPTLEELQILKWRCVASSPPNFNKDIAQSISHCRHLRVLNLELHDVNTSEIFITMANGCPLLKRFCLVLFRATPEMSGDQFLRLLRALPQVEILSLPVRFRMIASNLRDLVDCCSRLKVLEMNGTHFCLSLKSLAEAPSLSGLRELSLRSVWFKNPSHFSKMRNLKRIAIEWSRVFPQIRVCPCHADGDEPEILMEKNPLSGESDGDDDGWNANSDSEMSLDNPELDLDLDKYDSNLSNMRRRLWKFLGYQMDDCYKFIDGTNHMWQTDFEIETFGWPVIPSMAFVDPQKYSSANLVEKLHPRTSSA